MSTLPPSSNWLGARPFIGLFRREPVMRAAGNKARPSVKNAPAQGTPGRVDVDKMLAAARVAPQLEMLEWDDRPSNPVIVPDSAPLVQNEFDPRHDSKRRKIRDRYIGTRFPGVAECSTDLESSEKVIKAARLYFEEERNDEALELLELAIEECPLQTSLWLARLELLFLIRDAAGYVETARGFHQQHPGAEDSWAEVCRLGRALAPGETLFGSRMGPRDHEHYGPWPHTPNWIQAPWDLTAEISAADFHRAMSQLAKAA